MQSPVVGVRENQNTAFLERVIGCKQRTPCLRVVALPVSEVSRIIRGSRGPEIPRFRIGLLLRLPTPGIVLRHSPVPGCIADRGDHMRHGVIVRHILPGRDMKTCIGRHPHRTDTIGGPCCNRGDGCAMAVTPYRAARRGVADDILARELSMRQAISIVENRNRLAMARQGPAAPVGGRMGEMDVLQGIGGRARTIGIGRLRTQSRLAELAANMVLLTFARVGTSELRRLPVLRCRHRVERGITARIDRWLGLFGLFGLLNTARFIPVSTTAGGE